MDNDNRISNILANIHGRRVKAQAIDSQTELERTRYNVNRITTLAELGQYNAASIASIIADLKERS